MDPEDGDRSDESIDYLDINEQDAGLVDSDDAEEEIDDSAQDGGVLGGRSDWGTDPRPAVEIDEEAEGDYAVGDESGVQRGGGSHRRPGPRPAVHIDEDLFRSHCTRAGPDKLTDSQLSLVFGCTLARVKRLKALGTYWVREGPRLGAPLHTLHVTRLSKSGRAATSRRRTHRVDLL
jgi:hypothetical protein